MKQTNFRHYLYIVWVKADSPHCFKKNGFQLGFGERHVLWMLNIFEKETILFHFEKNWEHGIKTKKRHMIIKELSCLLKLFKIVAWDLLSHDFEKFSCYIVF